MSCRWRNVRLHSELQGIKGREVIRVADDHAAELPLCRVLPPPGSFSLKALASRASLLSDNDGPDITAGPSWWTVGIRIRPSRCRDCPSTFTNAPKPRSLDGATRETGSLGDRIVTPLEESPPCASDQGMHLHVKECGSVPCGLILSAGVAWGSGAR